MTDKNIFSFEIKRSCGVISESSKGWMKELNLVSWNGRKPKYDIRDWSPEHDKLGKGITISVDELRQLSSLINAELKRIDSERQEAPGSASPVHEGRKTDGSSSVKPQKTRTDAVRNTKKADKPADVSDAVDYDELQERTA